jgi:hypothetical protein
VAWLADDLLSSVRLRCRIPDGGAVASSAELCSIADEETLSIFVPYLASLNEEYGIATYDWPITSGVSAYRIPARASGTALRDVTLVESDGTGYSLPRISLEERDAYETGGSWLWKRGAAICLQRSEVILRPGTGMGGMTLRFRYQARPARLVLQSTVGQVTAIVAAAGGVVTQVEVDEGTPPDDGTTVDWVQATPGFDVLGMDLTWELDAGVIYDIGPGVPETSAGPSAAAIGDYIAPAGTTPIVQLPELLHPVLGAAVGSRVFDLMREHTKADAARKEVSAKLADLRTSLTPRIKGEAQILVNRDSPLRVGRLQ